MGNSERHLRRLSGNGCSVQCGDNLPQRPARTLGISVIKCMQQQCGSSLIQSNIRFLKRAGPRRKKRELRFCFSQYASGRLPWKAAPGYRPWTPDARLKMDLSRRTIAIGIDDSRKDSPGQGEENKRERLDDQAVG